jgi:hypothetical protein
VPGRSTKSLAVIAKMEPAAVFLEYLKVILTTPVAIGVLGTVILVLFRAEIRSLINRIASLKWGSAELAAPQLPTSAEQSGHEGLPNPTPPALPAGVTAAPQDAQALDQALTAERSRAYLWEYRYLNHFLVHATQRVLDWLASLSAPTTIHAYDAYWQPLIPSAEQRRTILSVLESHNLITFHGELIEVTPKGREYIQFRGPLPTLPSTTSQ